MSEALRKATLQALKVLEALDAADEYRDFLIPDERRDMTLAIMEINAALAEPEQEQSKTVMWRVRRHDCPDYWIPFMHYPVDAYADPEREVQELVVKSAAPPRREPLSDEQVKKLIGGTDNYWAGNKLYILAIARAIEEAHGITGGKE